MSTSSVYTTRLDLPRPVWNDNIYTSSSVGTSSRYFETSWSESIWGLSSFQTRTQSGNNIKSLLTTTNNRTVLLQIDNRNFTLWNPSVICRYDISNLYSRLSGRNWKFGQGSQFTYNGIDKYFLVPISNGNTSRLLSFYMPSGRIDSAIINIREFREDSTYFNVNWICVDPISNFLFVPYYTYQGMLVQFDIFDVRTENGLYLSRLLTTPNIIYPVKAQCGVFSPEGILYLLDNVRNTSGISAYSFGYNRYYRNYVFERRKFYKITKPEESIWSSDSQDMLGISFVDRKIYILNRDEDIGTDNFWFTTITGLQ